MLSTITGLRVITAQTSNVLMEFQIIESRQLEHPPQATQPLRTGPKNVLSSPTVSLQSMLHASKPCTSQEEFLVKHQPHTMDAMLTREHTSLKWILTAQSSKASRTTTTSTSMIRTTKSLLASTIHQRMLPVPIHAQEDHS